MINTSKLTTKQAIFVKEIAKGKTQRQACIIAYPNTRNWTINSLDVRASKLMKSKIVREEIKRLNNIENKNVIQIRKQITRIIVDIILENELEQKRICDAFNELEIMQEDKIRQIEQQLKKCNKNVEQQLKEELRKEEKTLIELQKTQRINSTNTNVMLNAMTMLCNMYGWREIGWEDNIVREEILTIEELQQMKVNNCE